MLHLCDRQNADSRRYSGASDLLFADPGNYCRLNHEHLDDFYHDRYKKHAANLISRYGFLALPIVDSEGGLWNRHVDDALDLIRETATNDIEKMAAITPTDKSYLKTGVFEILV